MANFPGTAGPDYHTGTDDADLIHGDGGQDDLKGEGGDDVIYGGDDWDQLEGGTGNDILYGGEGTDFLDDGSDSSSLPVEYDQYFGEGGDDYIQLFPFGTRADTMLLDGGDGNDHLTFNGQYYVHDVTIAGGSGNDVVWVIAGRTLDIDLGSGDDLIEFNYSGYTETFSLTLGAGADKVIVRTSGEGVGDGMALHITDFAAEDRLSLDNHLLHLTSWDRTGNPFASGHLALIQRGADAVLRIDYDGGGDGFQDFIVLDGVSAASLTSFHLGFAPNGGAAAPMPQTGTAAADYLFGAAGAETLRGLDGDDEIKGGAGDDRLEGGLGKDTLDGGYGSDVVLGEGDDDRITDSYGGSDQLSGGDGNDVLAIERGKPVAAATIVLDGGAGNDELRYWAPVSGGFLDTVTFTGGTGNDYVSTGGAKTAIIDVGDGDDHLYLSNAGAVYTITLGAGVDRISLESGHATGGPITVTDFTAGAGGDKLDLDSYLGGLGGALTGWDPQTNPYETGHLQLIQRGADSVLQMDRDGTGTAHGFVDLITFSNTTAANFTSLNLGGYSSIYGTEAGERLEGDEGRNGIRGFGGDDVLVGLDGEDTLYGGTGNDQLEGGASDDRLDGGTGADIMTGGSGYDTYIVDDVGDQVIEGADSYYMPWDFDQVETSLATYTIPANVEVLVGTSTTGQVLTGSNAAEESIRGGAGNDTIYMLGGINGAFGGAGDDLIEGGSDKDSLSGGAGSDEIYGFAGDDFLAGSQYGVASTGNDHLEGAEGNDRLLGSGGDDVLLGGIGNDRLEDEHKGTDLLDGGEGDDSFYLVRSESAPAAVATLLAGTGNDDFTFILRNAGTVNVDAGEGDDSFLFYSHAGTTNITLGAGRDTIAFADYYPTQPTGLLLVADFATGPSGDRLDLVPFLKAFLTNWDQVANPFGTGHLRLVQNGTSALLQIDRDGGGDNYATMLTFANVAAGAFTFDNLSGYASLALNGGGGDDSLRGTNAGDLMSGGNGADAFYLMDGGVDNALGGDGNDTFLFGKTLTNGDRADGGAGTDQLAIQGNYVGLGKVTLGAIVNVEQLVLLAGNDTRFGDAGTSLYSYDVRTTNVNVAAGGLLQVDASALRAGENLTFDGALETDGAFLVSGGLGTDLVTGGAGNDGFLFRGNGIWGAGDRVNGGAGTDQLGLRGDYDGANAVAMGASQIADVEQIVLMSGADTGFGPAIADADYDLTMHDGNVAAARELIVDAASLRAGETFAFNGAAELDGSFKVYGGQSADAITGGALADTIRGGLGADLLKGGGGNDTFQYRSAAEAAGDKVDGGSGSDTLALDGAMSGGIVFGNAALTAVERILLASAPAGGFNAYNLTFGGNNIAAGKTLMIDGSALRSGEGLSVNAVNETQGWLIAFGGAGRDVLIGGQQGDTLRGGLGNDYLKGNGGGDRFVYTRAADSTGKGFDQLVGFDHRVDKIDLPGSVSGWAPEVNGGALRAASFDADLAAALDAALGGNQAILFRPDSGDLAGRLFAVIDTNGDGAYQAGQDYVFEFVAPTVPLAPITDYFM